MTKKILAFVSRHSLACGCGLIAGFQLGALGCADTNAFPALTTTGTLAADGGGECGAAVVGPDTVLTAAHCVRGDVFYHAPGERQGRRVDPANVRVDVATDAACIRIRSGAAPADVMTASEAEAVALEGNVTGVSAGEAKSAVKAVLRAEQGDSGSAVRSLVTGAIVGVLTHGLDPHDGRAEAIQMAPAEDALALCAGL